MKQEDFQKKIATLRGIYLDDESVALLNQTESDITMLFEESSLRDNPVFIAIFKDAEKKLNDINALLMNDETLGESDIQKLHAQKKVWKFVFDRFSMKYNDQALALIDDMLNSKLPPQ